MDVLIPRFTYYISLYKLSKSDQYRKHIFIYISRDFNMTLWNFSVGMKNDDSPAYFLLYCRSKTLKWKKLIKTKIKCFFTAFLKEN